MKLYFFTPVILVINVFLLSACKKYKASDAAFFLRPGLVSVSTTTLPVNQGSGSSKITDLFLYVNGLFQGVYPNGSLMPIITKNQPVTINIFAGIKNNGISDTRVTYNLYRYVTIDTFVQANKTITRPITFKYDPGVQFVWMENFDSNPSGTGGYTIKVSTNTGASDTRSFKIAQPADCFEGRSLEFDLTGDSIVAQLQSNIEYPIPTGNPNVYLEINYKCTCPFTVGVMSPSDNYMARPAVVVTPQANWNKIYIELSDEVSQAPTSATYLIYFLMNKAGSDPPQKMFLDNIKLVTF